MTKTSRILALYAEGKSTREIAEIVGCRPEYVRVVARQRKGGCQSEHDRKYEHSIRASADLDATRLASRRAYKRAIKSGASKYDANLARWAAWRAQMRVSGRKKRAEAAC